MIITIISRHSKWIAASFSLILYSETLLANRGYLFAEKPVTLNHSRRTFIPKEIIAYPAQSPNSLLAIVEKKPLLFKTMQKKSAGKQSAEMVKEFIGGPGQPEMQAFQSANANNMVDLFSGDFSYNIPLLDVGGYPVNIAYRGGVTMDQEASWVGLGWNVNPGTISRNMRGVPDDFDGKNDSIKKITSIRENKTVGVTGGAGIELTGLPLKVGGSLGIFHNNYKGWGIETAVNATINSGSAAKGPLSGGLSITNNTQEGLTIAPSLSVKFSQYDQEEKAGLISSFSTSLPYNSRSGLKGLQLSAGIQQTKTDAKNQSKGAKGNQYNVSGEISSSISFASPSFTPTITMPLTSRQFSFTGKVGLEAFTLHPNFFISGYVSKQKIDAKDTLLVLPSYGYLHFQHGARNRTALLDFNREKEIAYREKPAVPHIAVPMYTYDAFSITGEGTGGMFRAYRGDIGFVYDHLIRTKDESNRVSVDVGVGNMVHGGIDLNINRAFTQNGPWLGDNTLKNIIDFKENSGSYEAVYFRNPGEKAINTKQFYEALGGDDVVNVNLYQSGISSSVIQATNFLNRYRNKRKIGTLSLNTQNAVKPERDKRTQVISYLTAKDADLAGLSKYIENYSLNQFSLANCSVTDVEEVEGIGSGLPSQYFRQPDFKGQPDLRTDYTINFDWGKSAPYGGFPSDRFSIRRVGRIKAPVTGTYTFTTNSDDGVRLWLNDSLVINQWSDHSATNHSATLNLIAGEFYSIKMDYYENKGKAVIKLFWTYPGQSSQTVPQQFLYPPAKEQYTVNNFLIKEKRVNSFRKENHLSQINVLNNDGRRYVYGLPVYNLKQKEASFAVNSNRGNQQTGLVGYTNGVDNTTNNQNGKDWYYNSEETPAYAHSFLLSGILSSDYVDVTGNGITEDDLGEAVKFNYSKVSGIGNPYSWRAPYVQDSVTLNEGLKTDSRDDKGNFVYGEKELWYLHSILSKTMVATFVVENRLDLSGISESGKKLNEGAAKRLKEINLYSRADFLKKGTAARPIKTVHFEYSYELCKGVNRPSTDSGKLTLKKIWFTYNGNEKGKQNPYIFSYSGVNPDYNLKSYERWGNFKDPSQNPGATTSNKITNAEYPYSLQDSLTAARNATAWMLDSVYLPSGGSIKVDLESDDYAYVQNKRALQMCKVIGFNSAPSLTGASANLYNSSGDNLYVLIRVPQSVSSNTEVYQKYLSEVKKLFFRISVKMPSDLYGSGNEYISCYADLATGGGYGYLNSTTIWVKLTGISLKGDEEGSYSPLAKAAIQFLRLNLPSKAYPGSEAADNLDLAGAIKMIFSLANNIRTAFESFDRTARNNSWAMQVDTSKSWVRLQNPLLKKIGGGHRVKRITLYDKWNVMTGGRAAMYGKEYSYTTSKTLNNTTTSISSGVASYEPGLGGEENPFRLPMEYVEKVSAMGPVTLGYSEEPLGESLFPAAGIGYSVVRTRSINYKDVKSANGYEETNFFTAYDFPTYTDHSLLDNNTKKRYKPALANFLRINARHYISLSQGFKIELNDMHGKLRSQATYAQTDPVNPVTYTENIYRVDNAQTDQKRLSNTVMAIHPNGAIDSSAIIGKDMEIMMDMREQLSITNGNNLSLNTDMFAVPFIPPFFVIPAFINLAQREENLYRSAATLKVIQRYGILDSVIHIDKGSKVSTKDILYDSETGNALITRTQNLFNDPVYNFSYPSHWVYDGMGLAYKNIDVSFKHITIREGKIISGLPGSDSLFFTGGDELLVGGKQKTGTQNPDCTVPLSSFPSYVRVWVIDSSVSNGGPKSFYFVDRQGKPYTGFDISLRIVRSGRRNVQSAIGSITTLDNPIVKNAISQQYELAIATNSKIVSAAAQEFQQVWSITNPVCSTKTKTCPPGYMPDPNNPTSCIKISIQQPSIVDSIKLCLANYTNENYGACGSYIYSQTTSSCSIVTGNNFWVNVYGHTLGACDISSNCVLDSSGGSFLSNSFAKTNNKGSQSKLSAADTAGTASRPMQKVTNSNTNTITPMASMPVMHDSLIGPLNRSGIWPCQAPNAGTFLPTGEWIGFTEDIYFPHDGYYYFGMGADNRISVKIDNAPFRILDNDILRNFEIWHIYPKYLTKGFHKVTISGYNGDDVALFGLEIYDNTEAELRAAHCYSGCPNPVKLLYSTLDAIDKTYYTYGCPAGYTLEGSICTKKEYTSASDSLLPIASNAYVSGLLGNWRPQKSYVYYSNRKEQNPATPTNIRRDGAYNDFSSFWSFSAGQLKPQYDTAKWVWNSETTLFNRKGVELENKDPLGRYSTGLYGYGLTMPVSVVQNSQNQESAYEGFEDYDFSSSICDTCSAIRHFDIGGFRSKLVSNQKHTGQFSLKVNSGEGLGITTALSDDVLYSSPKPQFVTTTNTCLNGKIGLQSLTTDPNARKEGFKPIKGKKMLLSLWVREEKECNGQSYINNRAVLSFNGSDTIYTFRPSGSIIEGWQRYESVFAVPAMATQITVSLESTGGSAVYFDDLRIHPYNANMKSFVYNSSNLRLMAELDENNYASFYEYDDDGTLIRVKKETERGIKTINETRSALVKQ